ncbi:endogenous retrovirus group K member 24 Gag poly protein-like, partial [Sigmodon hispidus]
MIALKELLKTNGVKMKAQNLQAFLDTVDHCAPWFLVSDSLTESSWEKLGKDLTRAQKEGNLPPGIMPIWSMIRECLDNHVGAAELERGAEELAKLKEERSDRESQSQEQGACGGGSLYPTFSSLEELCLMSSDDERHRSSSESESEREKEMRPAQRVKLKRQKER